MKFRKMHGLGNDFVIVDARDGSDRDLGKVARRLGDRRRGVGFDQLAEIRSSGEADARLVFWNSDGSVSATCGNATRCVARLIMDETGRSHVTLKTGQGLLLCEDAGGGHTRVNMGSPSFGWRDIPLAGEMDTLVLPIEGEPCALGLGNPHCVFFVPDAANVPLETTGPEIERHPLFPERTNVEFVTVVSPDRLRLRIWERGAGVTLASGSGACAALVGAARRGLANSTATVQTDGGPLTIDWRPDGVWKSGPTREVFAGSLSEGWDELP